MITAVKLFFTFVASGSLVVSSSSSETSRSSGSIRAVIAQGAECFLPSTFATAKTTVESLGCREKERCIQDSTSSVGGRCVGLEKEELVDDSAALSTRRDLQDECIKCQGTHACYGVDESKIGCGSCIGNWACYFMQNIVGNNSCIGENVCSSAGGDVGSNSCYGIQTCFFAKVSIGSCQCYGDFVCSETANTALSSDGVCPSDSPSSSSQPTTSNSPSESHQPSSTPSSSSQPSTSNSPSSTLACSTIATKVKLESTTGEQIHLFDVKVFSVSGVDKTKGVAANATQSSTYKNDERFVASNAIDSNFRSFSHTNDTNAWWQVDMGKDVEVQSLEIINRWCGDTMSVPNHCLCRLSGAKLSLLDANDNDIITQTLGNTCSKPSLKFDFDYTCNSCLPNASKLKLQSITGKSLNLIEVEVYSAGVNVAADKNATSSSTFRDLDRLAASAAVDEDYTSFSVSGGTDRSPWWEVNLGDSFDISNLKIFNRLNENLPTGGLCNLSQVTVLLLNDDGQWIDVVLTGDTCGLLLWEHEYESSPQYCLRNIG